jgi:RNA polymerase sigma-70 factor (ECF subfamily)
MRDRPEDWIRILDRLLDGDHLAFLKLNGLITGYLARLRAYDFQDEWDDLRQEVVLSVVENAQAGRLRDPRALLAYVRIITRNKFVDRLKLRLRRREKETLPWGEELTQGTLLQGSRSPRDESVADVWTAVGDLPAEEQRVIDGVYRQGKTYEAVSTETGIPLGTMKRRLRTGLATLRRRLREGIDRAG